MHDHNIGRHVLAHPLRGLTRLRDYDPYLSDLAALLTGVKPVIYIDFNVQGWPYIKDLCRRFRLTCVFPEWEYKKESFHVETGKLIAIFGFDPAKVRRAARLWNVGVVGVPWGVALGYPRCCVEAYSKWQVAEYARKTWPDLIKVIAGRTRPGEKLDFTLNNICNYYSRIRSNHADQAAFKKLLAINPAIDFHAFHVISWHPCAYNCRESAAAGRKIFAFLEYYLPDYARNLKEYLARPVVFFDKYEFITLKGKLSGETLSYTGQPGPASLAPAAVYKKFRSLSGPAREAGAMSLDVKKLFSARWKKKPDLLNFAD